MEDKIYSKLLGYIQTLEIVDTHEHLPSKEEDREKDTDVLKEYLTHYFNRDLISAGMPIEDWHKIIEKKIPIAEKWKLVEPYWEVSRCTGYGRSLEISVKELYGIERIDFSTIEELNNRFQESLKPGHFKKVLKEKSKIVTCLLSVETLDSIYDSLQERSIYCDKDLYNPVYSIGNLIYPVSWQGIERLEKQAGLRVTSFNRWLEVTGILIDKAYKLGAVALKNPLAYMRTLKYEIPTRSEAEEQFNNIFKTRHTPDWGIKFLSTGKSFQDYMFHYILDIADKKGLAVQIHTGMQEGSGNILSNSNPELLSNLFLKYPDVTFDIFHISYPFQNELTVLAKNYQNVFIDMCWAHIISPNASVNALLEWFDTVPLNKISAFGGDYAFIDGVYGHQYMARINIARALSIAVANGIFDMEKAKIVAGMLFLDNPKKIFRL